MKHFLVSAIFGLLLLSCAQIPSPGEGEGPSDDGILTPKIYYNKARVLKSRESMVFYSRETPGSWEYSYDYTYDDKGRLTLVTRTGGDRTVLSPTSYDGKVKTTINGSQKIVEEYADEDMSVLVSWTLYSITASEEKLESKIVSDERDAKGRVVKSSRYAMRRVAGEWTLTKISGSEIVYQDSDYKTISTETGLSYSLDGQSSPSYTKVTTTVYKDIKKTLPLEVTMQNSEWGETRSYKTEYSYNPEDLVTMVKDYTSDELVEVRIHSYSGNRHYVDRTTRYASKYVYQEGLTEEILEGSFEYEYNPDFVSPIPMRPEDDYSEAECSCSLEGLDVELSQCWQENGYVLLWIKLTNNLSFHIDWFATPLNNGASKSVATDNNGNSYTINQRFGVGSIAVGETKNAAYQVSVSSAASDISMMDFVIESSVNPDSGAIPATITLNNVRVHEQ